MWLSTQFTLLCHCCQGVTDSRMLYVWNKLIGLTLCLSALCFVGSLTTLYLFKKKIRLQSFVDESEREMMHEQIIVLQDKVHLGCWWGWRRLQLRTICYFLEVLGLFNISNLQLLEALDWKLMHEKDPVNKVPVRDLCVY